MLVVPINYLVKFLNRCQAFEVPEWYIPELENRNPSVMYLCCLQMYVQSFRLEMAILAK